MALHFEWGWRKFQNVPDCGRPDPMALKRWLVATGGGYRIFTASGLGEMHVEVNQKAQAGSDHAFWEALVHSRESGFGPLTAVLYLIEETREELIRQLEMILPSLAEAE